MKKTNENEIKYFAYCRRSSESEDRQALSIPSQIDENIKLIETFGLRVELNQFCESMSAKSPGRPVFSEMMRKIENGEANAIICWKLDRLARNFIDGGRIIDLLQRGVIREIRTSERVYLPSDNVFMIAMEFGMANQQIRDLSVNVKRGLRKKAEMGYPSSIAKIGYVNDPLGTKGKKIWYVNPITFPLVKQLFQMFLNGVSVREIWRIADREFNLFTPQRRKLGGKPIALSYIYKMLKDPVYGGFFYVQDKRYELHRSLPRVVSEEQYWKIQEMLKTKGRPKPKKRLSLYNHFLRCADCKGATTPDFKFQIICTECKLKFSYLNRNHCPKCGEIISKMKNPTYCSYVYYYCIRHKKYQSCTKGGIGEQDIEISLKKSLSEITLSNDLSRWCIENIKQLQDRDVDDALAIEKSRQNAILDIEKKLSNLLDLRISRQDISDEEQALFNEKEQQLRGKLSNIRKELLDNKQIDRIGRAEKIFSLMTDALAILENGSFEARRGLLTEIGSNLTLKGKKLDISLAKEVELFRTSLKQAVIINPQFEPKTTLADKDKTEVFASVCPTLLPR